jgi:hypothetical protein
MIWQVCGLIFLGTFWRDYYDSPYFNLCNPTYHYDATARSPPCVFPRSCACAPQWIEA